MATGASAVESAKSDGPLLVVRKLTKTFVDISVLGGLSGDARGALELIGAADALRDAIGRRGAEGAIAKGGDCEATRGSDDGARQR